MRNPSRSMMHDSGQGLRLNAVLNVWIGGFAMALSACGSGEATDRVVVADSAGVSIVTNSAAAIDGAPVWRAAAEPMLDVGVADGDTLYQLYRVRAAATLFSGDVAVLNNREIRVYDADGVFVRRFGREGEGPGEMRGPQGIWLLPGDSLLLFDEALQRATVFAATGTIGRVTTLTAPIANPELLTVFADGSLLVVDARLTIPRDGFEVSRATYVRYGIDGAFVDSLPVQPWGELGQVGEPGAMMASSPMFAPHTVTAGTEDTYWVATGPAHIERYDPEGELTHSLRWNAGDLSVSPDDIARYREDRLRGVPDDARPARERQLSDLPVVDSLPAVSSLHADRAGRLWVERFQRPGSDGPAQWLVFDRDGALIAQAELPPELIVLEIGEDYVLGVERDELDVEHLRRYPLVNE